MLGLSPSQAVAIFACLVLGTLCSACAGTVRHGSPGDDAKRLVLIEATPPAPAGKGALSSVTCLLHRTRASSTSADLWYLGRGLGLLCIAYSRGEISRKAYRAALRDYAALTLATYTSVALRVFAAKPTSGRQADRDLEKFAQQTMAARALCHIRTTSPAPSSPIEAPTQAPTWCSRKTSNNLP